MKSIKLWAYFLSVVLVVSSLTVYYKEDKIMAATKGIKQTDFIKANGKELKNNYGYGETVFLRGTNAGGLSVQEFWMCPTDTSTNVADQQDIWTVLTQRFGEESAKVLVDTYKENYWTESDFDKCASLGINCIRLPLWYRDFVDANNNWYQDAFDWTDWFVAEAGERGIYVILDMHGAYGSQNGSDHSGVDGGDDKIGASEFFFGDNAESNQEKYYQMWEKIAEHYEGNPIVAGYDLLNEPFCTYRYTGEYTATQLHNLLWPIYDEAYDRIRKIDKDHVIIMEAVWDSWDLPDPNAYEWTNVMYEYHQYEYSDYNNASGTQISSMKNKINNIFSSNYNVPSYIGEFCFFNKTSTWDEGLALINSYDLNWTSWTYKCVSDYGNWGLMNQSVESVNVDTDSYSEILRKWSNVDSCYDNTKLQNVFAKYTEGTVTHAEDSATTTTLEGSYYITCNDYVVCAEDSGTSPLVANRDTYGGAWETFHVIKNEDGTVSFQSDVNGLYVHANVGDYCQLVASSETIGSWEKFYLVNISGNQYGIISYANGKYVCGDFDDDNKGVLKAKSTAIGGAWESFSFISLEEEETTTVEPSTTAPTAPLAEGRHEAENADTYVQGGSSNPHNIQTDTNFSNGQAVGNMNAWPNDGRAYCTTTVYSYYEGLYTLTIGYAGGVSEDYPTIINARVNNGEWLEIVAPATTNWKTVNTVSIIVTLQEGYNSIDITGAVEVWYGSWNYNQWVNIDYFELARYQEEVTTDEPVSEEITTEETSEEKTIVISDDVKIEGYQISSTYGGSRVVASVEPVINQQEVTSWGLIYGLTDYNGEVTGITEDDLNIDASNYYVMAYASTSEGTINKVYGDSQTATYYVRTMKFVGQVSYEYTANYYVRAYALLADGSIVYSTVKQYNIYEVADYLYQNRKMDNNVGHEYLYNNILKVVTPSYSVVDYNWSTILVK